MTFVMRASERRPRNGTSNVSPDGHPDASDDLPNSASKVVSEDYQEVLLAASFPKAAISVTPPLASSRAMRMPTARTRCRVFLWFASRLQTAADLAYVQ
jgi:hypothetical protein